MNDAKGATSQRSNEVEPCSRGKKHQHTLEECECKHNSVSNCQSETTTKPTVALDCFYGSRHAQHCLACTAKGDIQSLSEYYDIKELEKQH